MKKILAIALLLVCNAHAKIIDVKTKAQYDELKAQGKPMLLEFYTTTCKPCKEAEPELNNLSNEYPSIIFMKLNYHNAELNSLGKEFCVQSVPTFIIFDKNGKKTFSIVSAVWNQIKSALNNIK